MFCISMDGLSGTGFKDLSERVNDLVDHRSSKVLGGRGTSFDYPLLRFRPDQSFLHSVGLIQASWGIQL